MEISRNRKYGEMLRNSVESYSLRDKMVLVMKYMAEGRAGDSDGVGGEGRETMSSFFEKKLYK